MDWLRQVRPGPIAISLRVQPGAKVSKIKDLGPGGLRVALAAPPVDGAANEELLRFLAELLGIRPSAVTLIRGAKARSKVVEVVGLDQVIILARLQGTS